MRIKLNTFIEKRRKLRLSQRKLAKKAGISHGTIARIEGGSGCHEETLGKIADAMNIDIKKLLVVNDFDGMAESKKDEQMFRIESFYSVDIIGQILKEMAEIKKEIARIKQKIRDGSSIKNE